MKALAYFLMIFGALTLMGGLADFSFISILIGGGISFAGYRVLQKHQKQLPAQKQGLMNQPQKFQMNDEMIMRLAKRLGGRLTAEQLSSQTSLSFDQAKERLEALHNKGICNINLDDIDENGRIYYQF